MDKMRQEFERYITHNFICTDDSLNRTNMNLYYNYACSRAKPYDSVSVLAMWQAWQASRAALVVELPTAYNPPFQNTWVVDQEDIQEALDKAGVQYE